MFISGCACWELLCPTRSLSRGYCSMGSIWTCLYTSSSPHVSVRFSHLMWLFLRLRSSSLSSASGQQLVSDTCGCRSLLLSSLACHSDYPYSFTCGNGVSMQPPSNHAMQQTATVYVSFLC